MDDCGEKEEGQRYLEPDDDEVPEADHAELRGRVVHPGFAVLDGDDVHEVKDHLERHDAHDEAGEVAQHGAPGDLQRSEDLKYPS